MTKAQRIITAYFAMAYWLPMAANIIFKDQLASSYELYPLTPFAFVLIIGVYGLYLLISTTTAPLFPRLNLSGLRPTVDQMARIYGRLRLVVGLATIALSFASLRAGLNSYRYSSEGLSQNVSPLLFTVIVLNAVISVDLLYFMFVRSGVPPRSSRRYWENLILSIAMIMAANGIAGMFAALAALFYSVAPRTFRSIVYVPKRRSSLQALVWTFASLAVLFVVFGTAWYAGQIIKLSSSSDARSILDDPSRVIRGVVGDRSFTEGFLYYLIERFSVYYYSLLFTANVARSQLSAGTYWVLSFPLQTCLYRLDFLLGGHLRFAKPPIASIMQLNYQLLTIDRITDRAGSSPGLIASFTYVFMFPLSLILCSLYLRWVGRALDVLFDQQRHETMSILGILLVLQLFTPIFFQSPFDLLMLIDDNLVWAVMMIGLMVKKRAQLDTRWNGRPIGVRRPSLALAASARPVLSRSEF